MRSRSLSAALIVAIALVSCSSDDDAGDANTTPATPGRFDDRQR